MSGTKPERCLHCDVEGFESWGAYKRHMRDEHPPETRFKPRCEPCGRAFATYPAWIRHMRAHEPAEIERRFFSKVRMTSGCWWWTGGLTGGYTVKQGGSYGHILVGDKHWMAHRFAYTQIVGPVPEGMELDHLCFNPLCVRPDHLEPVTKRENIRRRDEACSGLTCEFCGLTTNTAGNMARHIRSKHSELVSAGAAGVDA